MLFLAFLVANCGKPAGEVQAWAAELAPEARRVKELGIQWAPVDKNGWKVTGATYGVALALIQCHHRSCGMRRSVRRRGSRRQAHSSHSER